MDPLGEFKNNFAEIITDNDQVLVIHSGLWPIARKLELPLDHLPSAMINAIVEVAGPSRTIIMPAFTSHFAETGYFDLVRSRPETGIMVETFLRYPEVERTSQPTNSFAVLGPEAAAICNCPCTTAWGVDSVKGWLYKCNAKFISIGVHSLLSCSYYHYAEQLVGVPYRYFKRMNGNLFSDGQKISKISEVLYVKPAGKSCRFIAKPADERLEQEGFKLRPSNNSGIYMESFLIRNLVDLSTNILRKSPYAFVLKEDRSDLRHWIDSGGLECEIASLSGEQRYILGKSMA